MRIVATSLDEAWHLTLRACLSDGLIYRIDRGSFAGSHRLEIPFLSLEISDPFQQLIPIVPMGVPAPTSQEYVDDYLLYLMTSVKEENEQYTYGSRLAPFLHTAIDMLKATPQTNQACLEVARPDDILLDDPPCLRMVQFKARPNRLDMLCVFRSWDLWAGLPSNLAALCQMGRYVAEESGLQFGTVYTVSMGAHLYEYAWTLAETVTRTSRGLPTWAV